MSWRLILKQENQNFPIMQLDKTYEISRKSPSGLEKGQEEMYHYEKLNHVVVN